MTYYPTSDIISKLTKPQLVALLEEIPQSYWPPRPTRQDKATLVAVMRKASNDGKISRNIFWEILAVSEIARDRRKAAFIDANSRHPLPVSHTRRDCLDLSGSLTRKDSNVEG